MNTYESEERNPRCILRGLDDPLFDLADTSSYSSDSSPSPEPTVVTGDADERMVCDCCGCHMEDLHR
jgi:hypothetical protein